MYEGGTYPGTRVQHAGGQDIADDGSEIVEVARQDDGLLTKTSRGNLGDNGIADRADGDVVDTGEDQEESADGPLSAGVTPVDGSQRADDDKDGNHSQITADV